MPFTFVSEFGWSLLKRTLVEDDKTPIRSRVEAVEFRPFKLSNVTFSMDHVKEIKSNLGVVIFQYIMFFPTNILNLVFNSSKLQRLYIKVKKNNNILKPKINGKNLTTPRLDLISLT
jgi:hypothetical protein